MANLNLRRFDIDSMTNPRFKDFANGWYFGELVRGKRHGQGMFFWPGGQVYMGGWVDNTRSGYGIFRYDEGSIMIGNWNNKFMTGWGVDFEGVGPTIEFPLPEDEELREAMGEERVAEHKALDIGNYEFRDVFEGEFRGTKPGGYGTFYDRHYEYGYITNWTVGPHNRDSKLDGYGVEHMGLHPRFHDMESDDIVTIVSTQGMYINGELEAGPATQTISYWLRGAAIQVIQTTGRVDNNGLFDGHVSISLDGNTIYGGRVWVDEDNMADTQVFEILDEEDKDMIDAQRQNTCKAILEDGKDAAKYDSSPLIPNFADTTPDESWVMRLMVAQSKTATEIKRRRDADQGRLYDTGLIYTNRFFVTDSDGDAVCKSDGACATNKGLHLYFDYTFKPEFSTTLDSDAMGNPLTTVYIMYGNKIVGDFTYKNDKLKINTDDATIEDSLNYNDLGMMITLPMEMLDGDPINYRIDVEQEYADWEDEKSNTLTREETIPLEDPMDHLDDEDDDSPNMETMDVERDEDGNITGMGSSDPQNLATILNIFKNGGHFAPIDEIINKK